MPSATKTFQPATNITEAYNAVNPEQPLLPGDPRYVDCAPWRGDEHIVNMIARRIIRTDDPLSRGLQHLKQLLAGHRGCGKSTELLLLKEKLERAGYLVVYFDAALEIDMNDVDYADIENTLETEFRLEPQIPFFAKMMAAVRGFITSGSTQKKLLRLEVQQRTAQFLEDLNDLIDKLQQQLRDRGKKGLVIIIDSLDRIIPHPLDEKGLRTTHSAIYLDHAEHLKAPHCHVIYTVPISIFFNENLSKAYPDLPLMLPMVKIREENGRICADGLDAMRRMIAERVEIKSVFENKNNVDKLCLASGGHVRDLMHLIRYACDYSAEKITPLAVDKAIRALVREYDRLVKDADLPRLAQVHREKRLPSDAEYALLPYHLIVLEYQNGERWADLHPAVQETRKVREVLKNEEKALRQKSPRKTPR